MYTHMCTFMKALYYDNFCSYMKGEGEVVH